MSEETEIPVVIVGGGPIGLSLSYILGKNNIEHVLLQQSETTSKWPKSLLTNPRSMELFHHLGLDTILREKAMSCEMESRIVSSLNKPPVFRISLLQNMVGKNPRTGKDGTITYGEQWTTEEPLILSQIYFEPIVMEQCNQHESSEIKFGWQVQSISQTQENVLVEAVNVKTGEKKIYRASYAVGCDGGKSFVRKSLGIHFHGDFDLSRSRSITFTSLELKKRLVAEIPLYMLVKPGFQALLVQVDNEGHFVIHVFTDGQNKVDSKEVMRTLMDNEDIPYSITLECSWQGHFAIAETLQDGRIFLAGDACHVLVPVGGFGMNTGVGDAYDLGWKLVATIKGWGGVRLLSSYTIERHYYIEKIVKRIKSIFFTVQRFAAPMAFLCTTRPFKYITRLFIDPMNINLGSSGIMFGIRLDTSPLCIPSGLPLPRADPLNYNPIAYPGCRAPHFQFEDGTTLYDKLGSMFTLLYLQPSTKSYDPILSAAAHCGIPLKVLPFNDQKLKELYRGMDFVIIRPDLYIAWCANEIPTLLHNEDVNEGARMLMKVITGGEALPPEWKQPQKTGGKMRGTWWIPFATALFLGVSAGLVTLLRHHNYID